MSFEESFFLFFFRDFRKAGASVYFSPVMSYTRYFIHGSVKIFFPSAVALTPSPPPRAPLHVLSASGVCLDHAHPPPYCLHTRACVYVCMYTYILAASGVHPNHGDLGLHAGTVPHWRVRVRGWGEGGGVTVQRSGKGMRNGMGVGGG